MPHVRARLISLLAFSGFHYVLLDLVFLVSGGSLLGAFRLLKPTWPGRPGAARASAAARLA